MAFGMINDLLFDANRLSRFRGDFPFLSMSAAGADADAMRLNHGMTIWLSQEWNPPLGYDGFTQERWFVKPGSYAQARRRAGTPTPGVDLCVVHPVVDLNNQIA